MTTERLYIFNNYIQYLYGKRFTYDQKGRYIKHVKDFLENCDSVTLSGYRSYKKCNAGVVCEPLALAAICDLLAFQGVGFKRKQRTENKPKPLEKLSLISAKNITLLNDFIHWLHGRYDFSESTMKSYHYTIKTFFEYSNEFSQENAKRFVRTLETAGRSPATIQLRISALNKFGEWMKKPVGLKRPKFHRGLDTENVPTEAEYKKLLCYLSGKKNRDYYFFVKILASTGARVSEFLQFTWEDICRGEVVLKGKGDKYRRFFFPKQLQEEVAAYKREYDKTGAIAVGRYGKMTSRGLSQNMKSWGYKTGIDIRKMHPHAFRHFFAKMYLKKSKDVVQLAELLGHENIDITRIYLQKSREEQRKDFNKNVDW